MELNRQELYEKAMEKCSPLFETLKTVSLHNTEKVLTAFRESKLSLFILRHPTDMVTATRDGKNWKKCGTVSFMLRPPW